MAVSTATATAPPRTAPDAEPAKIEPVKAKAPEVKPPDDKGTPAAAAPDLPPKVVKLADQRNPLPPPTQTGVPTLSGTAFVNVGASAAKGAISLVGQPALSELTKTLNAAVIGAVAGAAEPTSGPRVVTPDRNIDLMAASFVTAMRNHDNTAMLDSVYGQRRANDPDFDKRLRQAITTKLLDRESGMPHIFGAIFASPMVTQSAKDQVIKTFTDSPELFQHRMLAGLSKGDQVLYNAYTQNPGGHARPEDLAQAGLGNWGGSVGVIKGVYEGLRAQYGDNTPEYNAAVRELDRDWSVRYGGGEVKLDDQLRHGVWSALNASDSRDYLASRLGDPDIVKFYNASYRFFGHDGEGMIGALMTNINRTEDFANNYTQIAPSLGNKVRLKGVPRLQWDVFNKMSGSEVPRAEALLDTKTPPSQRAVNYVRETLKAYAKGDVTPDTVQQALRTFASKDGLVTPTELGNATRAEIEQARAIAAKAGTPAGSVLLAQLDAIKNGGIDTGPVAVAEVRARLDAAQGDRDRLIGFARQLQMLTPEQRAAVKADLGADPFRRMIPAGFGPSFAANRALLGVLNDALEGKRVTPGDALLRASMSVPNATGDDVLAAINRMPLLERGAVPGDSKAWDGLVDSLTPQLRDSMRSTGNITPDNVAAVAAKLEAARSSPYAFLPGTILSSPEVGTALSDLRAAGLAAKGKSKDDPAVLAFNQKRDDFTRLLRTQAWDRLVQRLPDDQQRQIRSATSLPATPDDVDSMIEHVRKLSTDEQAGLSGWMGDKFGFTGPVARDSLRELVAAARDVRDVDSADDPRLRKLAVAQQNFIRTLETQAGERREIAENAQFYATLAVGLASMGFGFSAMGIARASLAVGSAAVGSKWLTLGSHYSAEEAAHDFIFNAASEAGGSAFFVGAGAGLRVIRPPVGRFMRSLRRETLI